MALFPTLPRRVRHVGARVVRGGGGGGGLTTDMGAGRNLRRLRQGDIFRPSDFFGPFANLINRASFLSLFPPSLPPEVEKKTSFPRWKISALRIIWGPNSFVVVIPSPPPSPRPSPSGRSAAWRGNSSSQPPTDDRFENEVG